MIGTGLFLMQQKLQDIQQHFQTTRERTKKLLEEKDAEIATLRADLATHKSRKFQLSSLNRHSTSNSTSLTPHEVSSSEQLGKLVFVHLLFKSHFASLFLAHPFYPCIPSLGSRFSSLSQPFPPQWFQRRCCPRVTGAGESVSRSRGLSVHLFSLSFSFLAFSLLSLFV